MPYPLVFLRLELILVLDIPADKAQILRGLLQRFLPSERVKLVRQTQDFIRALLDIDEDLQKLINTGVLSPYKEKIKDKWDNMNKSLAELQMLSLLEKVEGNCDEVINALLDVLSRKISKVNDILRSKLPQEGVAGEGGIAGEEGIAEQGGRARRRQEPGAGAGGGNINDKYLNKYLKYKNKYVYLKRNY